MTATAMAVSTLAQYTGLYRDVLDIMYTVSDS